MKIIQLCRSPVPMTTPDAVASTSSNLPVRILDDTSEQANFADNQNETEVSEVNSYIENLSRNFTISGNIFCSLILVCAFSTQTYRSRTPICHHLSCCRRRSSPSVNLLASASSRCCNFVISCGSTCTSCTPSLCSPLS